ncbi:MAG: heat-inducible transcription repressor HrcA [Fidelibacterota bacterium]|nr:MAG: heat-inducible transcription repressor HrcA [Candidatus Neomarinimicrobiota bacterium]
MKTMSEQLSERECNILAATVKDYIRTALPVASNRVKNVYNFALSTATIRNTMATLEQSGYLTHPHTSAGKIPTDKGYRAYVNKLMVVEDLDTEITVEVQRNLDQLSGDLDKLLQIIAHIIARLCGGVGITITPVSNRACLRSIRLVFISDRRMLFVLELDDGKIHTVGAEGEQTVAESQLVVLEEIMNERLCGLTLEEIQATVGSRLGGTLADDLGITTFILNHSNELFPKQVPGELHFYGLQQVLTSPEFFDQNNVIALLSLVENERRLRNLLLDSGSEDQMAVTIGGEHRDERLATFATISRGFYYGDSLGTMALVAPKRINYPQVFAVLEFISNSVSELVDSD